MQSVCRAVSCGAFLRLSDAGRQTQAEAWVYRSATRPHEEVSLVDKHDTTVYVGNLPWKTTEDDLLGLFRDYGPVVDVRIIQDPATGRSRGYGFVEFDSAGYVCEAVASLNGMQFQGRPLIISLARPKPARDS